MAPGLGAKETLDAVRAAMQQDTPGPDPLRPGGPDEDLAAFANDLEDAPVATEAEAPQMQTGDDTGPAGPPAGTMLSTGISVACFS